MRFFFHRNTHAIFSPSLLLRGLITSTVAFSNLWQRLLDVMGSIIVYVLMGLACVHILRSERIFFLFRCTQTHHFCGKMHAAEKKLCIVNPLSTTAA